MANPEKFFTDQQKADLKQCIELAELDTSGEIRVHIENNCRGDVMDRAALVFERLKMHRTKERNGVLFYLALADRKFAILGDSGINAKVPEYFWDDIKSEMIDHFHKEEYSSGLCTGIERAGKQLKTHFPYQTDDVNELSDEISFGKEGL